VPRKSRPGSPAISWLQRLPEEEQGRLVARAREAMTRRADRHRGLDADGREGVVAEAMSRWLLQEPPSGADPVQWAAGFVDPIARELLRRQAERRAREPEGRASALAPRVRPAAGGRARASVTPAPRGPAVEEVELGDEGEAAMEILLAMLPLTVAPIPEADGGGYELSWSRSTRLTVEARAALVRAAQAAVGTTDLSSARWASWGRAICAVVEAAHRDAGGAPLAPDEIVRRAAARGLRVTPDAAAALAGAALGRPEARDGRRSLEAVVRERVNAARARHGLRPLPSTTRLR